MECLLICLETYFIQHMGSFNYKKIRTMGAVLVAISIPIFTSQLEKSREAVDLANIRAAYAECTTAVLTDDQHSYCKEVDIKQQKDGWVSSPDKIAGTLDITTDSVGQALGSTNKKVWVCVSKTGVLSLSATASGDKKIASDGTVSDNK